MSSSIDSRINMPTEDKQNKKSNVQLQKLTPNSSLIEPYEPQLILPPNPSIVHLILDPPKIVINRQQNSFQVKTAEKTSMIQIPKISKSPYNPCDYRRLQERLKAFSILKSISGITRREYTIKSNQGEHLILFSNGQWLLPQFRRISCKGRYFFHICYMSSSFLLIETDIDIYQEYVPADISIQEITNNWNKKPDLHIQYLPYVVKNNQANEFLSLAPTRKNGTQTWESLTRHIQLSTPRKVSLSELILLVSDHILESHQYILTSPFLSMNYNNSTSRFTPICLWD